MTYRMFLDDERFPMDETAEIVRSSEEAFQMFLDKGFPLHIYFDHDLGGEDTSMKFVNKLIEFMYDNPEKTPPKNFSYSIHSQNPVGANNIRNLMNGWLAVCYNIHNREM